MEQLTVVGVEHGALVVASDSGERYRVEVDPAVIARLRQSSPVTDDSRRLAPREIQAQIRAGMSAEDVAAVTGAPLDYVKRFEGPVLAEREYVVESALAVPVRASGDTDAITSTANFGDVIRRRLAEAGAVGERWASWKEQGGDWIVKLTFAANDVEHDARWTFEPRKQHLAPQNQEAATLSQQGGLPAPLIPRLRAVAPSSKRDQSRFDSGAFQAVDEAANHDGETAPLLEPVAYARDNATAAERAAERAAARMTAAPAPAASQQTADLLEALRRRRGERDPNVAMEPPQAATGTIRLVDVPMDAVPEADDVDDVAVAPATPIGAASTPAAGGGRNATGPLGKKRGRASMPTWDDIVFGAKPDDDA